MDGENCESVLPRLCFTALAGVFSWLLIRFWMGRRRRMPPGPVPWPVLGNIPQLGTLPHQTLTNFAKKYGPLMSLKFGSRPTLVISSPQLAEEILKRQDSNWSTRGHYTAGDIMFYGSRDMVFGPRWRFFRSVMLQELLTNKRLADFKNTRQEEIMKGICRAIEECATGGKSMEISILARSIALNILMRMMMNEASSGEKTNKFLTSSDFLETMKECVRLMGVFCLGDFVPWLNAFDIGGYKERMKVVSQKMDDYFHTILEDHRKQLQEQPIDKKSCTEAFDVVDAMLTSKRDTDGRKLDDLEIKAMMQDFIIAGTDTTSSSLEWTLSELLKNPALMDKVRAEIDSVVGRERLVDETDLANFPYLQAVVKEALRLHPVGPILLPHASTETCVIEGFEIPAGTTLYVNVYAIQRDPGVWDRPLEFDPDRFLRCGNKEKDVHGRDFDLLPFGSGRRMCPGKTLGLLHVHYTLALMVQTCEWRLPAPLDLAPHELDMEERFTTSLSRLNPLRAVATPRVLNHLLRDFAQTASVLSF